MGILEIAGQDAPELRVRVVGDPDAEASSPDLDPIRLGATEILGRLAASCRARVLDGSIQLERELAPLVELLDEETLRACLLIPIQVGGRCRGFIASLSSNPESYGEAQVALARVYAGVLGMALDAAREAADLRGENTRLAERNRHLGAEVSGKSPVTGLADFPSPAFRHVHEMLRQLAATDAPVLISGESGTGKEVVARALHAMGERAAGPFVAVNCAALPAELIESELFGHREGAFSGAGRDRAGRFEVADGGTLLLDEIGDMPLELQPKLLRVLQEGRATRLGDDLPREVDVRVVAATNVDLRQAIAAGTFREDLFYRLNVFPLALPPLRERLEDLPVLCRVLLDEIAARTGQGPWAVGPAALEELASHGWPGNVRELANVLERSAILSPGPDLEVHLLGGPRAGGAAPDAPIPDDPAAWPTLEEHTRAYLERVLEHTGGQVYGDAGAARILGMPPSTLQSRLKRLGIDRTRFTR